MKKKRDYKGPFIEEVSPGIFKLETNHVKLFGGRGFAEQVEKAFNEINVQNILKQINL